jgi:DNA-binding NtrC family response regulator
MDHTVLVVDDEEDIRYALDIYLSHMGYKVLKAENGEEAISLFKVFSPAIILTDIKMPGMDGIELLGKIKQENPDAEVIMITGHGDMALAIDSIRNDATDFVLKPINDDALEIALKRAKDRMSVRQQLKECKEKLKQLVAENAANDTERS